MRDDRRLIEKEDWKKAPGIAVKEGETNSATALRDYMVNCNARYIIIEVKGYHIWWCSAHHQPMAQCREIRAMKAVVEGLKE